MCPDETTCSGPSDHLFYTGAFHDLDDADAFTVNGVDFSVAQLCSGRCVLLAAFFTKLWVTYHFSPGKMLIMRAKTVRVNVFVGAN